MFEAYGQVTGMARLPWKRCRLVPSRSSRWPAASPEVDYRHDLQHGGWPTGVTLAAPLYRIEGFGKLMRVDGRVIRIAES